MRVYVKIVQAERCIVGERGSLMLNGDGIGMQPPLVWDPSEYDQLARKMTIYKNQSVPLDN
jgi:hypothetical protein